MRKLTWLCAALVVAGCTLPTGSKDANGPTGARPKPVAPSASKAPAPIALTQAQTRQKGIVSAIQNTLVAGDLARSQNTLQLISNNGLGLISDNGLGLIANNGGGLISDNGLGLRVLQTPEVYYENIAATGSMTWVSTFYKPDYHGQLIGIPTSEYRLKGKAGTVVEHYTWDALGIDLKNPSFPPKFPLDATLTYKLKPQKTERFTFIKAMNMVFDMAIKSIDPPPAHVTHNGFQASYDMEVPLADGTKEVLSMKAYDMVYDPGQGLGGGTFYAPKTFKAKGENARGALEMTVTRAGDVDTTVDLAMALTATHTTKPEGRKSKLALDISEDNRQKSVVTDLDNAVEAVFDFGPDRTGSGKVQTSDAKELLGTISWTTEGMGSITFADGTVEPVRVF